MSRQPREASKMGLYHVMVRGAGRQILFEDENDYKRYIVKVTETKNAMDAELIAYCLMNNHVHLLIKTDDVKTLSSIMRKIGTSYANYYNKKYDHAGSVFQGRYHSEPINDEGYLLTCVRYIHNNPAKANLGSREEYPWSSYQDYIMSGGIADTELIYSIINGRKQFEAFSKEHDKSEKKVFDIDDTITIREGNEILHDFLDNTFEIGTIVKKLKPGERNRIIMALKGAGLSNRQIELITGISREIVKRAK